jgi:hypothetical protein
MPAPATLRAYQAGWQAFAEWRQLSGRIALPAAPETVAEHLASLATTLGRASLAKRLAAIGQYHRLANQTFAADHPAIHHTLRGIHREHGRPARRSRSIRSTGDGRGLGVGSPDRGGPALLPRGRSRIDGHRGRFGWQRRTVRRVSGARASQA